MITQLSFTAPNAAGRTSEPSNQPSLTRATGSAVRTALGKSGVTSIRDERIQKLQGFYLKGEEYPNFDPEKCLGAGWKQVETRSGQRFEIANEDGSVTQSLTLGHDRSTELRTMVCASMTRTIHEVITQAADGTITRDSQTAR